MRTNLPPANVTCTTGFRRRCADPLPGSGALALTGNGDASVEDGSNGGCGPLVGWACPGSPRWVPRTAMTSSSRRPAGTAADPAGEPANRVVIVEFSPHVPVAPRAEPRRATQTQYPAAPWQ